MPHTLAADGVAHPVPPGPRQASLLLPRRRLSAERLTELAPVSRVPGAELVNEPLHGDAGLVDGRNGCGLGDLGCAAKSAEAVEDASGIADQDRRPHERRGAAASSADLVP